MEILSKKRPLYKIFLGIILNPISDKKCEIYKDGALVLKYNRYQKRYLIAHVGNRGSVMRKFASDSTAEVIYLGNNKVIMPAFFDMHFHWVQDDVRTMPKDSLLQWLDKYTFPAEAKFADRNYSDKKARLFFERLVSAGTLGGAIYSSIHGHALEHAIRFAKGDFIAGNVLMTENSPVALKQSKKDALALVKTLSKKYTSRYALTPRFALSTTPDVMKDGSAIAKKSGTFTQTHLSETPGEIEATLAMYRDFDGFSKLESYTELYKKVGILGKRTILGHGIHLSGKERDILSKSKSAIAHCPSSNAPIKELGLGSGLFNFKEIEACGIRWALASDIGGGPFLSMFDVMRSFVEQNQESNVTGASYVKALYRSTLAGAEILNLGKKNGNFVKGKEGNFFVTSLPQTPERYSAENVLSSIIESKREKRDNYDGIVERTYLKGDLIFKRSKKI